MGETKGAIPTAGPAAIAAGAKGFWSAMHLLRQIGVRTGPQRAARRVRKLCYIIAIRPVTPASPFDRRPLPIDKRLDVSMAEGTGESAGRGVLQYRRAVPIWRLSWHAFL